MTDVSAPQQHTETPPLLTGRQRVEFVIGTTLWIAALAYFWSWWFSPSHVENILLYMLITVAMAWTTLFPIHFVAHYAGASRPPAPAPVRKDLRIAMVVTKAPSEPFEIVARTLEAMLAQDLPHDTWLADEDPSPETYAWCEARGVLISTRKGQVDYHRKSWPRRTKCKEGNLAYFYDHYGYTGYDVVIQLDADHIPSEGYLHEMVRPFSDPRVGYVSAPSICDNNALSSWAARGRLYAEGNLHGGLQAGYSTIGAPLCFGSHYAIRTEALRQIGGLGPELAEDHSTTMMMVAHGWRGVHAIDAIAHGDGPATFADLVTQEFQWSRSIVTILLRYSPTYLGKIPARIRLQFLFSQLWYPLFSLFMALGYLMPLVGMVFHVTFANVGYSDFLLHALPITLALIAQSYQWRSHGTFRPVDAKIVSWEVLIFQFARWPWSLLGCIAAARERVTGDFIEFRVTPKGATETGPLSLRVLLPYFVLAVMPSLVCLAFNEVGEASGYYLFAIVNALLYGAVLLLVVSRHAAENVVRKSRPARRVGMALVLIVVAGLPAASVFARGLSGLDTLSNGIPGIALTQTVYSPSGAGHGALRNIRFNPRWTF